jgi:hypothetical protein
MDNPRVRTWEENRAISDILEEAGFSLFGSEQKKENRWKKELRKKLLHVTMFRDGLKEGAEEASH